MSESHGSAGNPNLRARRLRNYFSQPNSVTLDSFFEKVQEVERGPRPRRRRVNNRRLGGLLEKQLTAAINGVPRCEAYQCGGSHDGGTDVVSLLFGLRHRWQCKREKERWLHLYHLLEDYGVEKACVQEPGLEPLLIIPMSLWIDHLKFINQHPPKQTDYP